MGSDLEGDKPSKMQKEDFFDNLKVDSNSKNLFGISASLTFQINVHRVALISCSLKKINFCLRIKK